MLCECTVLNDVSSIKSSTFWHHTCKKEKKIFMNEKSRLLIHVNPFWKFDVACVANVSIECCVNELHYYYCNYMTVDRDGE